MFSVFKLFILFIILSSQAFSKEQLLLEVGNGIKHEKQFVTRLYVVLNFKDELLHIEKRKFLQEREKLLTTKTYSIQNLLESVVLEERDGRNIITMQASSFSVRAGGKLVVTYLTNGITGGHKKLELQLISQKGNWHLLGNNKKIVKKLFLHPNWVFLLGLIGIKEIEAM